MTRGDPETRIVNYKKMAREIDDKWRLRPRRSVSAETLRRRRQTCTGSNV